MLMSKGAADKILKRWRQQTPAEADVGDVLTVVEAYLSKWAREIGSGSSHLVEIHHPMFARLGLYDGHGRFTIVAHQKKVKKCYIKDVLTAIEAIEMMERVDRER
jgi:prephenate dehydrogenase